jgi:hypothetical protein
MVAKVDVKPKIPTKQALFHFKIACCELPNIITQSYGSEIGTISFINCTCRGTEKCTKEFFQP